jgi:hypothetical protein
MIEDGQRRLLASQYLSHPANLAAPLGDPRTLQPKHMQSRFSLSYDVYLSATGFFDSSTSFSKRGSPRNGSQNGCKRS